MWPFSRKKTELVHLKEQVRLLRLEQEARAVNGTRDPGVGELREAFPDGFSPSYQGFGQFVNPYQAFYDGLQPLFAPVPAYWDYTLNLGFYVTEAFLDLLRMAARMWFSTQPQARGVIEGLRNYVIHTGFEYVVQAREGAAQRVASAARRAQRILDDFMVKNEWLERELDGYVRLHRDGEVIWRLFPQEDGVTKCRVIEPWQVRAPGNPEPAWLYGVHTAREDREDVVGYFVTKTGTLGDGEEVGADEVCFAKANTDFAVKRGVSDFLATQTLWEQSRKLLSCGLQGEAVRQAVAWIEQFQGAPAGAVQTLANTLSSFPQGFNAPASPMAGAGAAPPQRVEAGTVARIDKSMEMKDGPKGAADNAQTILTQAYRSLSVYFNVPEWMVSGFSEANFAQALVQESPLVRRCQVEQERLQRRNASCMLRVLRIAEAQGQLPEGACEDLDVLVEATPLVVRDPLKETQRNQILSDRKLISDRTWSTREDLDYDAEQEQRREDGDPDPSPAPGTGTGTGAGAGASATPGAQYKALTGGSVNGN